MQLALAGIEPLHATLIFGKKYTLLRSAGPTLISNRHVREWLIDQPTEIAIGSARMVIHPSVGVMATVVHAESLIDQAARLCKDPTPLIPESEIASVISPQAQSPIVPTSSIDTPSIDSAYIDAAYIDSAASTRLETIERLLESLQSSLDKMQASLGTGATNAKESIVESVTQEIDEFGKRLFTNLNDQLNNQSGVQKSMISNLAERFTDRFGAIDDQLNRFSEATHQHTTSLNELLAHANAEQELIEARFQEVFSHRNELIEAVQVLRSEIALAYQAPDYQNQPAEYGSESLGVAIDNANADKFEVASSELLESDNPTSEAGYEEARLEEAGYEYDPSTVYADADSPSLYTPNCVTDDQLADSLERAQNQIQDLNSQLKSLEAEREYAQKRVEGLTESWPSEPTKALHSLEYNPLDDKLDCDPFDSNEQPLYEDAAPQEPLYQEDANEEARAEKKQLPAWFKQDESNMSVDIDVLSQAHPSHAYDSPTLVESESNFATFSAADLTSYSDVGMEYEHSELLNHPIESSDANLDSISGRLQRMLVDADHRRGTANTPSGLRTSSTWSQTYSNLSENAFQNNELDQDDQNLDGPESRQVVESVQEELAQQAGAPIPFIHQVDDSPIFQDREPETERVIRQGNEEEESIEDYMQRLLHRVRGGGETAPGTETKTSSKEAIPAASTKPRSRVAASMGLDLDMQDAEPLQAVEKLSEELFVPRQQAPEQRTELAALRELANTNARRAISRSDIRRTNSAFFLKLGVTALAVSSAAAIFMINGFTLNAPFAGMVAATVVAILWGYDCIHHFKRLKHAGVRNQVTAEETAAGQSIQLRSSEDGGWRPTPA